MEFEDRAAAEWLEGMLKTVFERRPAAMCFVAAMENGDALTGYYNADASAKALFVHQIQTDITLEVVTNNAELLRAALEGMEDGGGPDD